MLATSAFHREKGGEGWKVGARKARRVALTTYLKVTKSELVAAMTLAMTLFDWKPRAVVPGDIWVQGHVGPRRVEDRRAVTR